MPRDFDSLHFGPRDWAGFVTTKTSSSCTIKSQRSGRRKVNKKKGKSFFFIPPVSIFNSIAQNGRSFCFISWFTSIRLLMACFAGQEFVSSSLLSACIVVEANCREGDYLCCYEHIVWVFSLQRYEASTTKLSSKDFSTIDSIVTQSDLSCHFPALHATHSSLSKRIPPLNCFLLLVPLPCRRRRLGDVPPKQCAR